jgi:hypothetical protein
MAKIGSHSPKTVLGSQNQYGIRKTILLGVKKAKMSIQSTKTEFGAENQ